MKVLVIGASTNESRVSNRAVRLLRHHNHEVLAIGAREGHIEDVSIAPSPIDINDVHTITLYINPAIQPEYYDYIKELKPKRVIFNPGTENEDFALELGKAGIFSEDACTLVLVNTGQF